MPTERHIDPTDQIDDAQHSRPGGGLAASGGAALTRDEVHTLNMSDAGRRALAALGLEPDVGRDTDRLLAMTPSGRQALAARGLRNSEIEALREPRG